MVMSRDATKSGSTGDRISDIRRRNCVYLTQFKLQPANTYQKGLLLISVVLTTYEIHIYDSYWKCFNEVATDNSDNQYLNPGLQKSSIANDLEQQYSMVANFAKTYCLRLAVQQMII